MNTNALNHSLTSHTIKQQSMPTDLFSHSCDITALQSTSSGEHLVTLAMLQHLYIII